MCGQGTRTCHGVNKAKKKVPINQPEFVREFLEAKTRTLCFTAFRGSMTQACQTAFGMNWCFGVLAKCVLAFVVGCVPHVCLWVCSSCVWVCSSCVWVCSSFVWVCSLFVWVCSRFFASEGPRFGWTGPPLDRPSPPPGACRSPGLAQNDPKEAKCALGVVHVLESRPPFHEKTSSDREERTKFSVGEGKKNAKFWGSHPSRPPPLRARLFLFSGLTYSHNWPNSVLSQPEKIVAKCGQVVLAQCGHGQIWFGQMWSIGVGQIRFGVKEEPEPNHLRHSWQQRATTQLEMKFSSDVVWPGLHDSRRATLRLQHGPLASATLTALPTSSNKNRPPTLPAPPLTQAAPCLFPCLTTPADVAANSTTPSRSVPRGGASGKRGFPFECVAAHVCGRQALGSPRTWHGSGSLQRSTAAGQRSWRIVFHCGNPHDDGVSSQEGGMPRPRAANHDGALQEWREAGRKSPTQNFQGRVAAHVWWCSPLKLEGGKTTKQRIASQRWQKARDWEVPLVSRTSGLEGGVPTLLAPHRALSMCLCWIVVVLPAALRRQSLPSNRTLGRHAFCERKRSVFLGPGEVFTRILSVQKNMRIISRSVLLFFRPKNAPFFSSDLNPPNRTLPWRALLFLDSPMNPDWLDPFLSIAQKP